MGAIQKSGFVAIEGIEETKAALAALDQDIRQRILRGALRDAGNVVKVAIEARAPVKTEWKGGRLAPGALKADLHVRISDKYGPTAAIVEFGKFTYFVARWVEYGHRLVKGRSTRRTGPGAEIGHVPAHPFIRPGFEASVREAIEAFVNRLTSELQQRRGRALTGGGNG